MTKVLTTHIKWKKVSGKSVSRYECSLFEIVVGRYQLP